MITALLIGVVLSQAANSAAKNDYSDPKTWLCRPGQQDACAIDNTTTVVAADGKLTREPWKADPNAPIDCFYVYPTVSTDPGTNSDMVADPAELNVIRQQFARFASVCRPYAPLYRQITLAGLRQAMTGGGRATLDRGLAYEDVLDAWNYYLQHDNKGRGVVLIGHSQGSYILLRLIRQEIDGKPMQKQLVSAILMGATVPVAKGKDVGGAFDHIPLCHSAPQTGCLITFVSFRSTVPPPANTLFGNTMLPRMEAACTNPAALAGGSGELRAYFSTEGRTITGAPRARAWVMPEQKIDTPFVSVPGLLTAKCSSNEHANYLEITVHGNPADPRTDDIGGDLGAGGNVLANWGLHLVDVNLAMGNLIDIVRQQTKAYPAKRRSATAPGDGVVQFRAHDIDPNFRAGYAITVADFNKDGRIDVIANSIQVNELAWYENPPSLGQRQSSSGEASPTWTRHVIVLDTQQIVNQALQDIDGDGIPELAFQSSFAMQAANSPGYNWIARSQGDPRKPWKVEKIDTFPTSHHVAWADLDGDGRKELLNAPLIGEKSLAPTYDQDTASLFWYDQKAWKRHVIANDIPGIIHRVRPVNWDNDTREEVLVASFAGVALYKATGSGDAMKFQKTLLSAGHAEKAPRLGASDARMGMHNGRRFVASVEPWHGNEVVVYNEVGGKWVRRVIFDQVGSGHEIAVADLNGDGRSDLIVNDNSRPTEQRPNAPAGGVHVFYAPADPVNGEWTYQRLEDQAAMNSCAAADLNNDKRMDIVCTGGGGVTRWYENLGK